MSATGTDDEAPPVLPPAHPSVGRALGLLCLLLFFFGHSATGPAPQRTSAGLLADRLGLASAEAEPPLVAFTRGDLSSASRTLEEVLWVALLAAVPLAALGLVVVPRRRFPRLALALAVAGAAVAAALVARMRYDLPPAPLTEMTQLGSLLEEWLLAALTLAVGTAALVRTHTGARAGRAFLGALAVLPLLALLGLFHQPSRGSHPTLSVQWGAVAQPLLLVGAAFSELVRDESARTRARERAGRVVAVIALLAILGLVARTLRPRSARDGWRVLPGLVDVCRGQPDGVLAVAFSAAGDLLASASWKGSVDVWDSTSGRLVRHVGERPSRAGFGMLRLAFAPSGDLAVAGLSPAGSPALVQLFDARSGAVKAAFLGSPSITPGSGQTEVALALAFSADGGWLALTRAAGSSPSNPGLVDLWASDGRPVAALEFDHEVSAVAADSGRDLLAIGFTREEENPTIEAPELTLLRPGLGCAPLLTTTSSTSPESLRFAHDDLLVGFPTVVEARGAAGLEPERHLLDLASFPRPIRDRVRHAVSDDGEWWVASDGSGVEVAPTHPSGPTSPRLARVDVRIIHCVAIAAGGRVAAIGGAPSPDAAPILVSLDR